MPLPGVPTDVTRAGDWTLQRLEREVAPPVRFALAEDSAKVATAGVEVLQVNGAGGDDVFYVLSSDPNLELVLDGGSGDDTFNLGGEHPPLIFDPPQTMDFVAKVAYYGGLDTLPGYQNVTSPSKNLFTADVGFVAVDTRFSPGAVDVETGHSWAINAHGNGSAGDLIPSLTGTFDIGFPLPLNHSSIWLRSGASLSSGARTNPLANSYLGGFGNNYVDSGGNGGAQRYRELLSMPGFRLDALSGKSLVKSTLEWCLPPLRFEALGSPGFYASWVRSEVFVSALETDPDNRAVRRSAHDVGAQLDLQLHVMHRQSMMLSVGVARGFAAAGVGRSEFMLSLQVL